MSEEIIKTIADHLEYLGYEIKPPPKDLPGVRAVHKSRFDIRVRPLRGGIFFMSSFKAKPEAIEKDELTYLRALNTINLNSSILRVYDDEHKFLVIEAWYPAAYDKATFATFIDRWQKDTDLMVRDKYEFLQNFLD